MTWHFSFFIFFSFLLLTNCNQTGRQFQSSPSPLNRQDSGTGQGRRHSPSPAPHTEPPSEIAEDTSEDPLMNVDLLKFHQMEIQNLTTSQILKKNEATLTSFYQTTATLAPASLGSHGRRVTAITMELAQKLLASIDKHQVVDPALTRYEQPGTDIGYCFGRAAYVHLALLKMGVAKQSIRKVWLVGPMVSPQVNWSFHVATAVRTTDGKWIVVDNFAGKLLEIQDWVKYYVPYNRKYKNLRLYITDAPKFSVGTGKYSRGQLGLDLDAQHDWYKHYFQDLMEWFQNHQLDEVGLPLDLRQPA